MFNIYLNTNPQSFDWNPIATIIGAFISAIATCSAVYLTSAKDRKARKEECNYKYYQGKLIELDNLKKSMLGLSYYFEKDNDCIMKKTFDDGMLSKDETIQGFKKNYAYICRINNKFANKTKGLSETLEEFIKIYNFTQRQVAEHRYFLSHGKQEYKKNFISELGDDRIVYCVDDLLTAYKDFANVDYNIEDFKNALNELTTAIEQEFEIGM